MKRITLIALCMAMIAAVSCGNNPKKKASVQEAVQNSAEVTESAPAEAPAAKAEKQKADAKKWSEKSDFDSVDEGIYDYLHSSMSNTLFGDRLKKNGEGVTAKDTTLFGRPAYVLTQEKTEDVVGVEMYTKVIEWVDKENGLPYYKYGLSKKDGAPYMEGKAFEVTAFSAEPTFEGLVVSLDGLTEIAK